MRFTFIGEDAQGSDDPNRLVAIYQAGSRIIRVPSYLREPGQEVALRAALYAEIGLDSVTDDLIAQWRAIEVQAATRPMATMNVTNAIDWVTINITDANTRTAFINLVKEVFILRAKVDIIEEFFRYLFQD